MSEDNCKTDDKNGKPHKRDDVVRWAVGILESQKDYRNMKLLGRGTYGDVRLMYDPERESAIAVKIVTSENISESELILWPKLHHPNVVPLLELLTLSVPEVAIFIMPVQNTTLNDVLYEKHFTKHYKALNWVTKWLYQILCGLEYLHSKELCHLDIKTDNILISQASVAMLCDFTFLNVTTRPLERFDLGLPYIYRPPEACDSMGQDILVDGKSYDMWGYGVMVLEIFTHFHMATTLQKSNCWIKDVYPTMFDVLQADNFSMMMSHTFIGARLKKFFSDLALNFIHGFLMVDYQKRISSLEATQHPLLKKGTIVTRHPPDSIWIKKVPSDDESCATFKKRCLQNFTEQEENNYSEESIYGSEIEEDMDYEASDEGTYPNSNATDDQSKFSNDDDLLKNDFSGNNSVIGEPNRIDLLEDMETGSMVIDVTSQGDLDSKRTQSSSSEEKFSKKFKSYRNSLQRIVDCKKECEQIQNEERDLVNYCKGSIQEETVYESIDEQTMSNHSSNKERKNPNEEGPKNYKLEVNNQNIPSDINEKQKLGLRVLDGDCFPVSWQVRLDSKEHKMQLLNKDSEAATSMDFWSMFPLTEMPTLSNEASKDGRHEVKEAENCPSNEHCNFPVKDSKWATGDSIKDLLDSSEKLSLGEAERILCELSSENDCVLKDPVTVTHQMKSLRRRLSELDQIFDEMQKIMVCENCSALNSEDADLDLVRKVLPTVSDIAASGESFQQDTCQNSFRELVHKGQVDYFETVHCDSKEASVVSLEGDLNPDIENSVLQAIVVEALDEDKSQIINIGWSRKFGRGRKLMRWIRNRCLELERVVKRCPYKIMKDTL